MPYGFDGPFSVAAPLANGGGGFLHRMMGQLQGGYGQQPHQQQGGYDSSGINPHGMYNGNFGQPQAPQMAQQPFPHNPGGFQPMGGLAGLARLGGY
jgi:hypothetical protein